MLVKRWQSADTAHVDCANPGALATKIDTPLQNGSVLEEGRIRQTWVELSKLGMNLTDEQVRWVAGLNDSLLERC